MTKASQEVIENVGLENRDGRDQGTPNLGSGQAGGFEGGPEEPSTGGPSGNEGTARQDGTGSGPSGISSDQGGGSQNGDPKDALLKRIRSKRRQGHPGPAASEIEVPGINDDGRGGLNENGDGGNAVDDGSESGPDRKPGRSRGRPRSGNGQSSDDTGREQQDRVKPKGINVKGKKPPKITPIESEPEELLTDKEAKSLVPQVKEALYTFFKAADQFASMANRKKEVAVIWQTIDDDDTEFIATYLIEGGMKNKVMAATVRGVARANKHLRLGIISLPRFYLYIKHFMDNGFANPFGGK